VLDEPISRGNSFLTGFATILSFSSTNAVSNQGEAAKRPGYGIQKGHRRHGATPIAEDSAAAKKAACFINEVNMPVGSSRSHVTVEGERAVFDARFENGRFGDRLFAGIGCRTSAVLDL
jgi:hypothetical protein